MGNMFGKRQVTGAVIEQSPRPSKMARIDHFSAKKYEVFISHRGPDVKHSLAYHISDLLEDRGIQAFLDIKEMDAGEMIPQQIHEAIESSEVQIVIFSQRFAESKWCLDELTMMIKKCRDGTSIVIPIFYDVQPYEVRSLKGNFGQNFMNKHQERQTIQKIEEWKKALQEASKIAGFCFPELRGALGNKVVTKVCNYLQIGILHVPDNVVGIEQLLTEKVKHILDGKKQGCGLTCVEITGIGGIGKTTFAYALYNTIRMHFKRCCFIEDVKDKMEKDGPLQIHKTLLKDLFYIDTQSSNIAQAKSRLKKYIENEDVLIVLDDIDLKSRVSDILVQDGAFLAPTSVIIVTSRDTHILKNDMAFCKSREVIRVKIPKLLLNQSKKVFCEYAFGAADFEYDNIYGHLVHKIVKKCDGIPLALKLFGRHVSGEDISYWECFWEDIHDSIPGDLKEVLQSTFKSLDSELAKQIFLDVAIFFHGEKIELLENIWVVDPDRNKGHFKVAFEKLKKKCLVEITMCGELRVHDVLRDMAKAIVDEENELEPGYRSRLWRPDDVKHVLSDEMRTEKVKGMRGLWIKKDFVNPCSWSADVFVGMPSLKVLIVEGKCIHGDLSKLPKGLLFLRWRNYPYTSVPIPLKFVRVVDFSFGHQEYLWESHAEDAPVELRQLILQGCSRIQKLPEWTEKFRWLGKVDMSNCRSLQTIPESFGLLQGLEELDLNGCRKLQTLPESSGSLSSLRKLSLDGCHSLQELPETLGRLPKLWYISLKNCKTLKSLPESFGWLKMLEGLSLNGCSSLENIPETFSQLEKLRQLNLDGCDHLRSLPESFGWLKMLEGLSLNGCSSLENIPETFGQLEKLRQLNLDGCDHLKSLPESFGWLKMLEGLSLNGCSSLEDIPETFGQLEKLANLYLSHCDHLKSLPDSFGHLKSLAILSLCGCKRLERLPPSFFMLPALQQLIIEGCGLLEPIGERIASLTTLTCLVLPSGKAKNDNSLASGSNYLLLNSSASATVEDLPVNIGDLCNLLFLELYGFSQLELPQSFGKHSKLTHLTLKSCFNVQQFPNSSWELHRLEYLYIGDCPNLQRVSNLPTYLREFYMDHCESVEVIDVSDLHSLQRFHVRGCTSLKSIMGLIRLDGIEYLTIQECMNLMDLGSSHITDNNVSCCWDLLLMPGLDPFKNLSRLLIQVNGQVFCRNSAATETNIIVPYNSPLLCDAVDQSSNLIGISSPKCSFFPLKLADKYWVVGGDKEEEFSFVASAIFLIIRNRPSDRPFCAGVSTMGTFYEHEFLNEGDAALLQMEIFIDNPKKASVGNQVVIDRENLVKEGWICYLETEGEICDDNEKVWDYFVKECKRHLRRSLSTASFDLSITIAIENYYTSVLDPSPSALMKHMLNPY